MKWVLVGKTEEKRQLGRCRRGWQGSMKIGLDGIVVGGCGIHSFGSGWSQVAGCFEHINSPVVWVKFFGCVSNC